MKFKDFSSYLQQLEAISSRLKMTEVLAELYQQLASEEIQIASYLMKGSLVPEYQSLEFNFSIKMLLRALAKVKTTYEKITLQNEKASTLFSLPEDEAQEQVKKSYQQLGDIGLVAEEIVSERQQTLNYLASVKDQSILEIYQQLKLLALKSGPGSMTDKLNLMVDLFEKVESISAKFIARIVLGKLRLGFSTMTMLDALSYTHHKNKDDSQFLESLYQKKADVGLLAKTYLSFKEKTQVAANYDVAVGVPVLPALCQRLNSSEEIIEKMKQVLAEPKYDGLRVQIHVDKKANSPVTAYTRNLENVTHMFPELSKMLEDIRAESCILDSEAVGVDPVTNKNVSFQETITRKRKHGVTDQAARVPIKFFVFDCLSFNHESLIDQPLEKRKQILTELVKDSRYLEKTKYLITNNALELHRFHEQQLKVGLEGAVIKKAGSVYKSGRKGWLWVKIKEEEGKKGKLKDTLDLVVMGYYFGRGKRTSFGIGAFLAGVMASDGTIKTIAKIGTGLTDQQLKDLKSEASLFELKIMPKEYTVAKNLRCDVWLEPKIIVEIAADEITRSPIHSAKVALRFPRLVQFRKDKALEQITTLQELQEI